LASQTLIRAEEGLLMLCIKACPLCRRNQGQLTGLVNARATAVVPSIRAPVSMVLGDLDSQPGETIVDPG